MDAFALSFANDDVGNDSTILDNEHGRSFIGLFLTLASVG